jgi:quinol monooxygenase YgiN
MYQDDEDENTLSLVEEWTTEADLQRHLRSDKYRKVLAVMESAFEAPELRINTVSHVAGFEVIEAARAT